MPNYPVSFFFILTKPFFRSQIKNLLFSCHGFKLISLGSSKKASIKKGFPFWLTMILSEFLGSITPQILFLPNNSKVLPVSFSKLKAPLIRFNKCWRRIFDLSISDQLISRKKRPLIFSWIIKGCWYFWLKRPGILISLRKGNFNHLILAILINLKMSSLSDQWPFFLGIKNSGHYLDSIIFSKLTGQQLLYLACILTNFDLVELS